MAFRNKLYCDTFEDANDCVRSPHQSNVICHVMKADDNEWDSKYVVITHIVCEYCSMCESQGDLRCVDLSTVDIPEYKKVEWVT